MKRIEENEYKVQQYKVYSLYDEDMSISALKKIKYLKSVS